MSDSASSPRAGGALAAGVVIAAVGLVGVASLTPAFRDLERRTFDLATALTAPGRIEAPIVIVAIDEPSFAELRERWPFPRELHARVIDRVAADGALAIGFDVLFAEASGSADRVLADAIRRAGNVVLALVRDPYDTMHTRGVVEVRPLEALMQAGAVAGNVGLEPDPDFVVRRLPDSDDAFARMLAKRAGVDVRPLDENDTVLIRYAGPRGTVPAVHYYQAAVQGLLPPGFFRGKIVLVGLALSTSPEISRAQADQYNAPFFGAAGAMPGVEIHANSAANLIERRHLIAIGPPAGEVLAIVLAALVAWIGYRRGPLYAAASLLIVVVALPVTSLMLFARADRWLSWLLPVTAAGAAFVAQTVQGALAERARVRETRRAFARYVPPELVRRIADDPEALALGGEERELTVMFADLANFTELAEGLAPREVVRVLSDYFDAMTRVIHAHGGTVDKYIGDGIMAFWGAPLADASHARRAIEAAIAMQRAFTALADRHSAPGRRRLEMRIGIHSGPAVVGNVGSALRFTYTAVGDTVNLASRLEGANKRYGTSILVSESTVESAGPGLPMRPVDAVTVQGRREVVHLFTPCSDASLAERTRTALELYRARRFEESAVLWRAMLTERRDDALAAMFAAEVDALAASPPPPSWTGVTALGKS